MTPTVQELLREWIAADEALKLAHDKLRDAALAEYPVRLGDTVRVGKKVGRVVRLRFHITSWDGIQQVEVRPSVYPIKKDGATAKVGEIFVWYTDKIEVIDRAPIAGAK